MLKLRTVLAGACLLAMSSLVAVGGAQTRIVKAPATPVVSRVKLGVDPARDAHPHTNEPRMVAPVPSVLMKLAKVLNTPTIEVGIEPLEGDAIVYHPVVGKTAADPGTAQVSVSLGIKNKETKEIKLTKVKLVTSGGSKEIAAGLAIPAGGTKGFQNNREYHKAGDVLYLNSPVPSSLTLELTFDGYSAPVKITKPLKPYAKSFTPPFKSSDLANNEFWESASTHGGGSQVFAYDMGVHAYVNNAWTHLLPGKDGSENNHYRVWGKPIYAMADGEVEHFVNDCPANKKPFTSDEDVWSKYPRGGAGNHFYVKHGDVIALYAHMQEGSLNSKLLTKGAKIKKGDLLGLAGNSGSSSGPHLHVHIRKETSPESGPFRPLLFKDAFAIYRSSLASPGSNVNWAKLNSNGIAGYEGQRSFIWPSATHPDCAYPGAGAVARHGVSDSNYQKTFDSIWTCGLRPSWVDGFDVGGKTYYNVVFQKEDAQWVARHNLSGAGYQTEFDKWAQAGYKLVTVDSYMNGGNVRYAAVWSKASGPAIVAYHGASDATHQTKFEQLTKEGWAPVNVSIVAPDGKRQITALYQKKNVNGLYARHAMTTDQYKAFFKEYGDKGFKLAYLNGYVQGGKPMLSGVWHKTTPYGGYIAKHYQTGSEYQTEFEAQGKAGFKLLSVTGYEGGGKARYDGLWVK